MNQPWISLASLSYRMVDVEHTRCLWGFLLHKPGEIVLTPRTGDALVDRGRSILASAFLRSDCEVQLCVDSDILFRPEDAYQICEQAREYGIVAGVYITRSTSQPVPATQPLRDVPLRFGPDPTPQEVLWVGGGFVAIAKRVFGAIREHDELPLCHASKPWAFWPFHTPMAIPDPDDPDADWIYLSEDWAMAARARAAGYPSYINGHVRLEHLGLKRYALEDMVADHMPAAVTEMPMTVTRTSQGTFRAEAQLPGEPSETDRELSITAIE